MSERVRRYYDGFDEWGRLETPAGRLEWLRVSEIVDRWLPARSVVLDLGGGPGRLAIRLAQAGHHVVLADLSPRLVAEARRRAGEAGIVLDAVEADARELSRWMAASFDVVLAFGPFYHLTEPSDRGLAVEQIARVTKPGGLFLAQVIPRLSGVQGLFERASVAPAQVAAGAVAQALTDGVFANASDHGFPVAWYPHLHEARSLFAIRFEELGFESLRGLAAGREAAVLALAERDPDRFGEVMDAVRATAADPAVVATGAHAIWIGRRREGVR